MCSSDLFAPLGAAEIAIYLMRDAMGSFVGDPLLSLLVDLLLMNFLQNAVSFTTIIVMSALVAVAYLRLSPRIESVYRVFD